MADMRIVKDVASHVQSQVLKACDNESAERILRGFGMSEVNARAVVHNIACGLDYDIHSLEADINSLSDTTDW